MLPRLNSLWVGDRLGYIEQLCLLSAQAAGHEFTLYSYTPEDLRGAPEGVDLRDAREVMPEENLLSYADSGSFALGANLFRYELLARGLGYWVDMDFYFLRPLDFREEYVFGWENDHSINNAILFAPADSGFVSDLRALPRDNECPQWFGPRRSLLYYWERLRRGHMGVADLPWGTYGPQLVTYLVKKHALTDFAQPLPVFYPLPYADALALFAPAERVEAMIRPESRAIHMWHSRLFEVCNSPPPRGSFIDLACRQHGIETRPRTEGRHVAGQTARYRHAGAASRAG